MEKTVRKHIGLVILACLLVVAMLPVFITEAFAAAVTGLTVPDLTAEDRRDNYIATGDSLEVIAYSKYVSYSNYVTLKNNKATAATLEFDYEVVNAKSATIGGASVTGSGHHSVELAASGTLKVEVSSNRAASASVKMTNIKLYADVTATTTFNPSDNGNYTVNGESISSVIVKTQSSTEPYELVATPTNGYKFLGWYSVLDDKLISQDATYSAYFETNQTVTAKFVPTETPLFETNGMVFSDLNAAVNYASSNSSKVVTLVSDGTLPAGDYTITSGITLLIPFDEAKTLYTTEPENVEVVTTWPEQYAFRTLTMDTGAHITVNGAISVGSKQATSSQKNLGHPVGPYGQIDMLQGSSITLNDKSNLYAWGYIVGNGSITAESGATVYECFQISDWRGGSASMDMMNAANDGLPVFPFSQYYVQNIEAALTIKAGASEKVYLMASVSSFTIGKHVPFVGTGAMFQLEAGASFVKTYDPATDRMSFDTYGNVSLNSIFIDISIPLFLPDGITSEPFTLPVNNNVDLRVHSGTVTTNQDVALQPGATMTIDQDAKLVIGEGCKFFVYDRDEWIVSNYCQGGKFGPVVYSPTRAKNRTEADLKDVVLDVNGTIEVNGLMYTTAGGASIISSEGTGEVILNAGAGDEEVTYQATQTGTEIAYEEIPIVSAMLQNADGSYTETADAVAGDYYYYENGKWIKYVEPSNDITITFDPNGGSGSSYTQTATPDNSVALLPNDFTNKHAFLGWATTPDGEVEYTDMANVIFGENTTLYAVWADCADENKDHKCDACGADMGEHADANTDHACDYGCSEVIGTCADTNKDHACDYGCGKSYGTHEDTDKNHACDYGCSEAIGTCADVNLDHVCDYGCGKAYGEHVQAPSKHTCDYCNQVMSQCEDKDGDGGHFCYICTAAMNTPCHGGTATCENKAVCTDCREEYGELNFNNHTSNELRYESLEDLKHNVLHDCCGTIKETVGCEDADSDHNCDFCLAGISEHKGGEATCIAKAICEVCGEEYGEENKQNHIGDTDNDHRCEACGDKISECKDENPKNHYCDICGEKLSDCADNNNDHDCDYCGAEDITSCVDSDKNHACDICGATMGEHADANKDHVCDYGCSEAIGTCADTNKDHVCDYGCGKSYGEHVDENTDHVCDYGCSEAIGTCADTNKDHVCDYGCGKSYGEHVDENTDHVCDYGCSEAIGTCEDANKDHVCDYGCDKVYGEHVQAEGKHTCDYCGEVMSQCSGGEANCLSGAICEICGDEYTAKNPSNHTDSGVNVVPNADKTHSRFHNCCGQLKDTVNCAAKPGTHNCDACNNVVSECADVNTDNDHNCDVCGETIGQHVYSEGALPSVITPETKVEYTFTCDCGDFYTQSIQGLLNVGSDTYYINGDGTPVTGLMKVVLEDGHIHYYYFNVTSGKAEKAEAGQTVLVAIEKTNGFEAAANGNYGIPQGQSFYVDENGILVHVEDTSKNGFVAEANGKIYNYVDGIPVYLGLVKIDGDYYYVRSSGELVVGRSYYVTRTNDLLDAAVYGFDAEGKLILDGIVGNYYYVDGVLQKCGLFELDGKYYYARTSTGELIKNRTYWVTKTNGVLYEGEEVQPANYQFNENGEMAIRKMRNGIVEEDGVLYYYRNDKRFYAGLIEIDGELYYIRSNGQVAVGNYWITKTNGILEAGKYSFGEDGKMIK